MHDSRHVACCGLWSPHPKTRLRIEYTQRLSTDVIKKEYNFALGNLQLSYEDLEEQLRTIFQNEHKVFRINFSMGIVLRNAEVKLGYFYASRNETALPAPFQISKLGDVDSLILRLRTLDILQTSVQSRPDWKWSIYVITNIR